MSKKPIKALGLSTSAFAFAMLAIAGATPASAHPHDALAQCQLPDGSWVMCDETIHDTITNEHVKENQGVVPGSKIKNLTAKPKRKRKYKRQN